MSDDRASGHSAGRAPCAQHPRHAVGSGSGVRHRPGRPRSTPISSAGLVGSGRACRASGDAQTRSRGRKGLAPPAPSSLGLAAVAPREGMSWLGRLGRRPRGGCGPTRPGVPDHGQCWSMSVEDVGQWGPGQASGHLDDRGPKGLRLEFQGARPGAPWISTVRWSADWPGVSVPPTRALDQGGERLVAPLFWLIMLPARRARGSDSSVLRHRGAAPRRMVGAVTDPVSRGGFSRRSGSSPGRRVRSRSGDRSFARRRPRPGPASHRLSSSVVPLPRCGSRPAPSRPLAPRRSMGYRRTHAGVDAARRQPGGRMRGRSVPFVPTGK